MNFNIKKLCSKAFCLLGVYHLARYLFAHAAYMHMQDETGIIFEYITLYLNKITDFLVPAIIGVLTLLSYTYISMRSAIKISLISASATLFFSIPYYYIIFIYNYGYDSIESLTLAAIATLTTIIFTFILSMISLAISLALIRKSQKLGRGMAREYLTSALAEKSTGDFSNGANPTLIVFPAVSFVYLLINELIDTVTFFTDYRLDYTAGDIIVITLNYVLLFFLLALSYLVMCKIKNGMIKNRLTTDESI